MHADHPAAMQGRAAFASIDAMHPPFQVGSFDVICMCAALHHIAFPDEFLKRLARMLSHHGRFAAVREPCLVNPFEPTYIAELTNGFNEQMFELSEWHVGATTGCSGPMHLRYAAGRNMCGRRPDRSRLQIVLGLGVSNGCRQQCLRSAPFCRAGGAQNLGSCLQLADWAAIVRCAAAFRVSLEILEGLRQRIAGAGSNVELHYDLGDTVDGAIQAQRLPTDAKGGNWITDSSLGRWFTWPRHAKSAQLITNPRAQSHQKKK
jgi:Methyltransferase domain